MEAPAETTGGLRGRWRWCRLVPALLVLLSAAPAAEAQRADTTEARIVTIVSADAVTGEVVGGERVRTLLGGVHLRQDSTDLRARRATQFLDRNEIVFEGDVEIADPGDTLSARRVTYDSRTRFGRAEGDVRLADAEAVLFSARADYFRTQRRAEFPEPVRLVEREGGAVLTSERGTYLTGTEEAFFVGDVRLVDSLTVLTSARGRYGTADKRAEFVGDVRLDREGGTRLEADTLTHERETGVSRARGAVRVERFGGRPDEEGGEGAPVDSTQRTLLFGDYAFHDDGAEYSRVERVGAGPYPLVVRLQTDSTGATDTLLVRARLLEALRPDALDGRPPPAGATLQRLLARDSVRLWSPRLAALADSAVVDRVEGAAAPDSLGPAAPPVRDELRLYEGPVGWLQARGSTVVTEVSGDTLRALARGESLDTLRVLGRAFAARPDSALGRVNQIRGREMLALFREDSLRWLKVWPNAEAVYYRADEAGALAGAVQLSADSLAFRFRGDDLAGIHSVGRPEGLYYDAALVPNPLRLEGYRYTPERRPTRRGLLGPDALDRHRGQRTPSPAEAPPVVSAPSAGSEDAAGSTPLPGPPGPVPPFEGPPDSGGAYTWVIASLVSEDAAEHVAQQYRASGVPARVVHAAVGGQQMHRVTVGRYPTPEAAEASRAELPAEVSADAWLLRLDA